jgi:hypothetical protein
MLFEELPDRITPMPTCSVNIQPDSVATKLAIKVSQHFEEALSVAAFCLNHPGSAKKRSYPAGNIQAPLMLAGCRDFQPLSDERPATAKPRVQRESAFILKNNGFFRSQRFEFFLGPWRTSSRQLLLPEDTRDWPALTDTQVDASSIGPGGPSALSRTDAVNGLPGWGRPTEHDLNRTSGAILPDGVLAGPLFLVSSGPGVQSVFSGLGHRPHPYLPPVSSGLCSSVSGQGLRKSNWVAALPVPEGG